MKTIYRCEICGAKHDTEAAAIACEARPMIDFDGSRFTDGQVYIPEVGEIVECSYPASSWWDGMPEWSAWHDRGGRFLDGYYARWIVVAKIPASDRHEWHYVLWTPSSITGAPRICWTGPGHTRMFASGVEVNPNHLKAAMEAYSSVEGKRIELL